MIHKIYFIAFMEKGSYVAAPCMKICKFYTNKFKKNRIEFETYIYVIYNIYITICFTGA